MGHAVWTMTALSPWPEVVPRVAARQDKPRKDSKLNLSYTILVTDKSYITIKELEKKNKFKFESFAQTLAELLQTDTKTAQLKGTHFCSCVQGLSIDLPRSFALLAYTLSFPGSLDN